MFFFFYITLWEIKMVSGVYFYFLKCNRWWNAYDYGFEQSTLWIIFKGFINRYYKMKRKI